MGAERIIAVDQHVKEVMRYARQARLQVILAKQRLAKMKGRAEAIARALKREAS